VRVVRGVDPDWLHHRGFGDLGDRHVDLVRLVARYLGPTVLAVHGAVVSLGPPARDPVVRDCAAHVLDARDSAAPAGEPAAAHVRAGAVQVEKAAD